MTGKIKTFNMKRGFGFITGVDDNDYFVHISQIKNAECIAQWAEVIFTPSESLKGKVASNVEVQNKNTKKPSFILFAGTRINANNIKNYGITQEKIRYVKVYEHSRTVTKDFLTRLLNDYLWNGLTMESPDDDGVGARLWVKSWGGEIIRTSREYYICEDDFIYKTRDYLYVTTYQGDNYRFYADDVGMDIYKKCEELDRYFLQNGGSN